MARTREEAECLVVDTCVAKLSVIVTGTDELTALGDSLDWIEVLIELEDKLNTTITNEQIDKLKTVDDVITLVETL